MTRILLIAARMALWALGLGIALVTLAPFWDTNLWWVRMWDFPRVQIAAAGLAVLVAALCLPGRTRLVLPVLMALACGYQLWRVLPYTPLASAEMALAPDDPGAVTLLSANVLMENDRHDLVAERIAEVDPDILLLMETDQAWIDALEPALARYPHVLRAPRDDHYGLVLATRLEPERMEVVTLTDSDTPAAVAQLRDAAGRPFRFVGLHPRPPVPGEGTAERDAEIYLAARFARASGMPVVAAGDFNDVAWSDTSRTFKHVGEYLDPRIGRGFHASFDVGRWWFRVPIDQLYVTPDVAVVSIERLREVGSDHFPMAAVLRIDASLAARLNEAPEPVSEEEREIVARAIGGLRVGDWFDGGALAASTPAPAPD